MAGLLLVGGSSALLFAQATNCGLTLNISFSLSSYIQINPTVSSLETYEGSKNVLLALFLFPWPSLCPFLPIIVSNTTLCLHRCLSHKLLFQNMSNYTTPLSQSLYHLQFYFTIPPLVFTMTIKSYMICHYCFWVLSSYFSFCFLRSRYINLLEYRSILSL